MKRLKKFAATVAAWKERIAIIALGQTFNAIFDWFFNYPVYGHAIEKWGLINGYIIMAVISFFVCLIFIKFYDWLKIDWLGIEVAKKVKDFGPIWIKNMNIESRIGRILWWPFSKFILFLLWAVDRGGLVAFFALSMFTDPFITTVYMRRGWYQYDGLSSKDWRIFLASTVVSNGYWAIRTFALLKFLGVSGYIVFLLILFVLIIISMLIKKRRERSKK